MARAVAGLVSPPGKTHCLLGSPEKLDVGSGMEKMQIVLLVYFKPEEEGKPWPDWEGLNEFGFRRELYVIALRQLAKKQALGPTGYGDMDLGCLRHPQVKLRARFAFGRPSFLARYSCTSLSRLLAS